MAELSMINPDPSPDPAAASSYRSFMTLDAAPRINGPFFRSEFADGPAVRPVKRQKPILPGKGLFNRHDLRPETRRLTQVVVLKWNRTAARISAVTRNSGITAE